MQPPTQTADKIQVDPKTAAAMLDISPRTLFNLTRDQKLPVVRIGRSVRYRIDDLRDYVAGLAEASISQPASEQQEAVSG